MDLLISLSLILNVFPNLLLVAMQPHGVDVVPCRPELAAPEELFDFRMLQENLLGCDTFCDLGYLGWQHHRHGLDQEVDMVIIGSDFHEVQVIRRRECHADFLERLFYRFAENFAPVLCRTDQMIQHAVYIVPFPYMFRHAFSIPLHGPREHPGAELRGNLFDYIY